MFHCPRSSRLSLVLPSFKDISERKLLPSETVSVYVSGSSVAGWSHAMSDVDLYVITEKRIEIEAPSGFSTLRDEGVAIPIVADYLANGCRLDVEYWSQPAVNRLLRRIRAFQSQEIPTAGGIDLNYEERDFLYRLSIGIPISGELLFDNLKRQLIESDLHREIMKAELNEVDDYLEDTLGQLQSGDSESALLAVRLAFEKLVDSVLADLGDLCPNPKWRAQRMKQYQPALLPWETYWKIETMQELEPSNPSTWIKKVFQLCRDVIMRLDIES